MNLNDEPQVSPDVPTKHESCGVWCVCVFVVDSDGHRLPATAATVTAAAAAGDASTSDRRSGPSKYPKYAL